MPPLLEHEKKAELWFKTLKEIPEEEQKAWIIKTLRPKSMLHIFGRYFFQHIIRGRTPYCHIELIREMARPEDSAIIFPRGFAKSTWEKIDTLHDIVYALEPVILYISDTADSVGLHFESIKGELENNNTLRYVYGNLVPIENDEEEGKKRSFKKWTNKHFETTNGINMVARGAGNGRGVNIRNNRPTKVIVDDAETDEQVSSVMRRQKYHDWIYNVVIPSLDKERGRIKIIGTVIHPECEVLKFYRAKGGIFKKAIENIQGGIFSTGKSIWESYWSIEDLLKRKDGYTNDAGETIEGIGTRAFMQEYMNEPTNIELARVNPEWIDNNLYVELPQNDKYRIRKVIAIDPQSGEKNQADEYAITVLAWYTGSPHKYVLEQLAGRGSQMHQVKEVIAVWKRHSDALAVGVEKVMTQVAVYQLLLDWRSGNLNIEGVSAENRDIPIRAITPEGKDKVARFQKQEPTFERGEIHLRPEMRILREQILFLGTKTMDHDDRADSLIMTLELSSKVSALKREGNGIAPKAQTITGNLQRKQF